MKEEQKNAKSGKNEEMIEKVAEHERYIENLGFKNEAKKDDVFANICFSSLKNGFIFRPNGSIEKCTICISDKNNSGGEITSKQGVNINTLQNSKWYRSNLQNECLICRSLKKCLNKCCRKSTVIDQKSSTQLDCYLR